MTRRAGSVVAIALGVLAWWTAASLRVAGKPLVATPWDTVCALPRALPTLLADLSATTGRALLGLALGAVAGIAIGLTAALAARVAPVVEGLLDFARSIPPVVMLPVFLLAFGYNDIARTATIAAGCAWIMALSVTTAATAPPSARREMLDLVGATKLQALAWTQPWESLPVLAVGLRGSASTAVIVAVVTEMIAGSERGIGSRIISAQIASDTTMLTLSVLGVGAVGFAANVALRRLESWARGLG
jgi:ABC-type nitrate/sulfonate/bicarbonate transport system permease component